MLLRSFSTSCLFFSTSSIPTNSTLSRLWSWRVGETLGLVFGEGAQKVTRPTRLESPLPPPLVPLQLSENEESGVTPLHPSPIVGWLDPLPADEDDVTKSTSSVSSSTLISNLTSLCCWKTSLEGGTLSTFCGEGKDAEAEETTTPCEFLFTSIPFCAILIWRARNYMTTTVMAQTVFLWRISNFVNKRTYDELAIPVRLATNSYQVLQVSVITVIISITIAYNHRFLPVPPGASNTSDFKSCNTRRKINEN